MPSGKNVRWVVEPPRFKGNQDGSIYSPMLLTVPVRDKEAMDDFLCLEDIDPSNRDEVQLKFPECTLGDLGSMVKFWRISQADRITMGFKMPTAAAFTSMPNYEGIIAGGGGQPRGYNDKCGGFLVAYFFQDTIRCIAQHAMAAHNRGCPEGGPDIFFVIALEMTEFKHRSSGQLILKCL